MGQDADQRRKLAAIVSIDVAGYSALTERDPAAAAAHVARLRAEGERIAALHGGRIFSTAGDGAMLEFASASQALGAAIALCDGAQDMILRFGVHLGEVTIVENGDLLGHGVNVAARLQGAAEPGAILISQIVRDTADSELAERFQSRGRIKLEKMRETLSVFAYAGALARTPSAAPRAPLLAVLAFDNISGDRATRFFSDGVSEEILYTVSRVRGLRVIGASSSFSFRGRAKKNAAKALAATHVLDGSVRREGDRVRIAAHLTDAESNIVLWSERYDRDLSDAFALQEEIGAEVAAALTLVLGAARAARARKVSAAVFDAYLRAREHLRAGAPARVKAAAEALSGIVHEAPDFARGWAALAVARLELMRMARTDRARLAADAREAAERAIGIDADIGEAYAVLATLEAEFGQWRARETLLLRALEAEPNNPFLLFRYGQLLISVGRVKEGMAQQARAHELDPLDPMVCAFHGYNVWATQSQEEGRVLLDDAAMRAPGNVFLWYMRLSVASLESDFEKAAALREEGVRLLPALAEAPVIKSGRMLQDVMRAPTPEAFVRLGEDFMEMAERQPSAALDLAVALSVIGMTAPALAIFEEALDNIEAWRLDVNDALRPHVGYETALLFIQATISLRMNPGFVRLCKRLGLVAYWNETGVWPDCVGDVSSAYDFRAEAARLN